MATIGAPHLTNLRAKRIYSWANNYFTAPQEFLILKSLGVLGTVPSYNATTLPMNHRIYHLDLV